MLAWNGGGVLLDERVVGKKLSYKVSGRSTLILAHGLNKPSVTLRSGSANHWPWPCHTKYSHLESHHGSLFSMSLYVAHHLMRIFQSWSAHPVDGGRGEFETHLIFPRLSPSDSLTSCSKSWICYPLFLLYRTAQKVTLSPTRSLIKASRKKTSVLLSGWKQIELTLPPRPLLCRTRRCFFLHLSSFEIAPA